MCQVLNGLIRPIVNPSEGMFNSNVTHRTKKFQIGGKGWQNIDLPNLVLLPVNSFHA